MNVSGENVLEELKMNPSDLFPVTMKVKVADNRKTEVLGGAFVELKTVDKNGAAVESKEMMYFVKGVRGTFLSKSCCKRLGIVSKSFPTIEKSDRNENRKLN